MRPRDPEPFAVRRFGVGVAAGIVLLLGFTFGGLLCFGLPSLLGIETPGDSSLFYPLLSVAGAVAALASPRQWPVAPLGLWLAMMMYLVSHDDFPGMFGPLSLIGGTLVVVCLGGFGAAVSAGLWMAWTKRSAPTNTHPGR